MDRAEPGRGGNQHQIDPRVDEVLVGIESVEDVVVLDVDAVLVLALEVVHAFAGVVLEGVCDADDLDRALGAEVLARGAGAPASAADQADLDLGAALHERADGPDDRSGHYRGSGGHAGRCLDEITSGSGRLLCHSILLV